MTTYTGDILLQDTGDGDFDMLFENCQPDMTNGLETYVFLAVFGEDWWGNGIVKKESEKMKSTFPAVIRRNVVSDKTKNDGIKALEKAMEGAKTEKIAKSINVTGEIQTANRIAWQIDIEKPDGENEGYLINWNTWDVANLERIY